MRNFTIKAVLAKIGLITLITPTSVPVGHSSQQDTRPSEKSISVFVLDEKEIFNTALASHCSHSLGND